ncbi:UNVERIFIED_CONTAM: hypothetical protein GTU68_025573 [Idotea baltica]|nr:hypothetical protein [Idotea baltica]
MSKRRPVTTKTLQEMKESGEKIAMLTCYDYTSARLLDKAEVDVLLVGDSASNVFAGHETTLPITLEQMLYHAAAVVRGASTPLVVVDLPFGSYQGGPDAALNSAIRVMKESGAHAVKLEGGLSVAPSIRKITEAGIPVMGHLGLTPQSIYQYGSYKVRAKEEEEARTLEEDAILLQESGCFALVLEKIPAKLAAKVQDSLSIPVIGIGAGADVAGQVLVLHDALGLTEDFNPRFVKRFASIGQTIVEATKQYCAEVKDGSFPSDDNSY